MTKNISRLIGILISISIVITGICFIVECLSIYNSGDEPYSREAVGSSLKRILAPIVVTFLLILYGIIADILFPFQSSEKMSSDVKMRIDNIASRRDFYSYKGKGCKEIKKEVKKRVIIDIVRLVLFVVGLTLFFCYALRIEHFHQTKMNESMIKAMMVLLCTCGIPFLFSIFSVFYNEKSMQKQLDCMLSVIKDVPQKTPNAASTSSSINLALTVQITILIVGIGLLIFGFVQGGTADVLAKAAKICTECIGLG